MRGALPVVHAALAMAKGPAGVGSAGGADKATVAAPEALGPGAYGRARGGRCERPSHGEAWHGADAPRQEGERASSRKEHDLARGTDEVGTAEEGSPRDLSGHRKNATEWGLLTSGDCRGRDEEGHGKNATLAPTSWGPQKEGPVRKGGGCDRVRALTQREDMSAHGKKRPYEGQSEGGHAECLGVGILGIIEASQGIVGETRPRSVNEVGALGWLQRSEALDLRVLTNTGRCG